MRSFAKFVLAAAVLLFANAVPHASRAADGNAAGPIFVGTIEQHLLNAGSDWRNYEWLEYCGWKNCGDGGGGKLHKQTCTYNGMDCLMDSKGQTFKRQDFNWHLAQAGVVKGSAYDCMDLVPTCTGAAGKLKAMNELAVERGQSKVYGDGLQIKLAGDGNGANGNPFEIDGPVTFDNGVDGYVVKDPVHSPGTIWTEGTTVVQVKNEGGLVNASVLPAHLPETYPDGFSSHAERVEFREWMIAQGQTGVACTGGGCTLRNLKSGGYDSPADVRGPRTFVNFLELDGNVFLYAHDKGDAARWSDLKFGTFLTGGEDSTEYFSIDNVTCSGGLIRVKFRENTGGQQAGDLADITDGIHMIVSGLTPLTGATSAWGEWDLDRVSDDTFNLPGSQCTGANLDGPSYTLSAAKNSILLTGATDLTNVRADMIVSGSICLTGNTRVKTTWEAQDIIVIDTPTTCAISSASLTFSGGALTGPTPDCEPGSGGGKAPCGVLTTAVPRASGNSPAGIAAEHHVVGFQCGAPIPEGGDITQYKVAGMQLERFGGYGVEMLIKSDACEHGKFDKFATDSIRKTKLSRFGGAWLKGDSKGIVLSNGQFGKTGEGFGILVDAAVDDDDAEIGEVTLDNVSAELEVNQGRLNASGQGAGGTVMVANEVKSVQLHGDYHSTTMIYEGAAARAATDTSGAIVKGNANWWGGHFEPGGAVPVIASGAGTLPTIAGGDSAFRITVGSTPGTTTIVVTFANTWLNAPVCNFTDETTAAVLPKTIAVSTTSVSIGALTGLQAADKISGTCTGWSN